MRTADPALARQTHDAGASGDPGNVAANVTESLARKGEAMTTAAMATYAYDQIDQARAELDEPS